MSSFDSIQGDVAVDKENVYKDIKREIKEKIQPQLNNRKDFGVEFLFNETMLCSGLIKITGKKIISLFKDNRLTLDEATQLDKDNNNKPLERPRTYGFQIDSIDMSSFKIISKEEVEQRNKDVISRLKLEEKQGTHMDDISELGFKISDSDERYKVPIEFKHDTVDHVVVVTEPIQAETIISELPQQSESKELNDKLKMLSDIAQTGAVFLEGSKIKDSIDKVLSKDTQSDLKARYESLKQSIKAPIEKLNKQLTDSLEKIAKGHNAGISNLIQQSSKAALETRRKYKLILNKTQNAVKDRLAGKSTGLVGSLKSSKLQKLGKSLGNDESELDLEIKKANKYISLKERLLNWSNKSVDKSKLTEEQIDTIVDAFEFGNHEQKAEKFIENLKINTMSIISLVLKVLKSELDISTKYAPQNKDKLITIIKEFMESLRKMNGQSSLITDSVEQLLDISIETYDHPTNDVYFTPMKLYEVKDSLMSIITSAQPVISDISDTITERSTSSSSSSSSSNQRKLNKLMERKRAAEIASDTLTPVLNRIKDDVSEYIPDIKLGQVLLTTERELKRLGRSTGESKEKHYYLDIDGKVKKIGSNMTYKLAVNDDGSIPPQLAHLGAAKRSPVDSDLGNTVDLYKEKDKGESFFDSPFGEKRINLVPPVAAPETTLSQEPAPRKSVVGNLTSFGKGFLNRIGARTSKNTSVEGGKRRTRKFHKNKTHKRR